MRKHSRRNRYFLGEIESEREQIRCYMEFEEWKREGLTLYLVACAVRVLKQYGILGDMDWCEKIFLLQDIIDFELSPGGWLLTGTIWIWRVPRGKGYGSIDGSPREERRTETWAHNISNTTNMTATLWTTMDLLSCQLHRSCHRHTPAWCHSR